MTASRGSNGRKASLIFPAKTFACQTLQSCNDAVFLQEVRAAFYRGFNEVDEVEGRSPVERAAAALPDLRRRCA